MISIVLYNDLYTGNLKIYRRSVGKEALFEQWNLLIPIMLTYRSYYVQRQTFKPNQETSSIELIEWRQLYNFTDDDFGTIFDGSILAFVKHLLTITEI